MCGCEHHRDHNAPCTCTCPGHKAVREEMSRNAPMSATDHTLTAPERENIEELLRLHVLADDEQIVYDMFETLLTQRGVTYEARLATAEAEKEALRERVEYVRRDSTKRRERHVRQLQGRLTELAGVAEERGYDVQAQMERAEAAEAALAGLVAAVEALAQASLQDGRGGAWVHDVWFRALIDADHAAALRAHEALAWDDAVTEGFDGGWLHDAARDDLLARNPYRADSIEQAHP